MEPRIAVLLIVALCTSSVNLVGTSSTTAPDSTIFTGTPNSPTLPPTPSWIKCLRADGNSPILNSSNSMTLVSLHWCRNADFILKCLEEEMPQKEKQNPLDYFASLNYNPKDFQTKSEELCSIKPESEDELSCAVNITNNDILECSILFKQAVDYLFFVRNMTEMTEDVLLRMTCDITRDVSRCLAGILRECDEDVMRFLIGYYGLFTNNECLHNVSISVQPLRPVTPPEQTVMVKCGIEAMTFTDGESSSPPKLETLQPIVISIIRDDCRLYRQRFLCYEREFPSATSFLDIWQNSVFNLNKSIKANQQFCSSINEFTSNLDPSCYDELEQKLQDCEGNYGRRISAVGNEWSIDKTKVDIQKQACIASINRADCLKKAFKSCGDSGSRIFYTLQIRMLPDVCFPNGLPADVPHLSANTDDVPFYSQTTNQPTIKPTMNEERKTPEDTAQIGDSKGDNSNGQLTVPISLIFCLCLCYYFLSLSGY